MNDLTRSKIFNVYVDEAGNTIYYNDSQPVVLWAGVITDQKHSEFEECIKSLLKEFQLNEDIEIHASRLWGGSSPFNLLSKDERYELFFQFMKIGIEYIKYYHSAHDIKPFRRTVERKKLKDRNLNPLLSQLLFFMTSMDFYFEYELGAEYNVYFDKSNNFENTTKKLILELREPSNNNFYLKCLIGEPGEIDSVNNRFIQLSDVIGYMIVKQSQLESNTFTRRNRVLDDKKFIEKCYNTIISKKIPFVKAITCSPDEYKNWSADRIASLNRMFDCWNTRDFTHFGNWLPKKSKPDDFRYDVNTYWMKKNDEILHLKDTVEKKPGHLLTLNFDNVDKTSCLKFGQILKEVFTQLKEIYEEGYKKYSDLPGFKSLVSKLDEYILAVDEKYDLNPDDITSNTNEIAESILREAKLIPDSDEIIRNQLPDKKIVNVLDKIYSAMRTIKDNSIHRVLTLDEMKVFLDSNLPKYSDMITKCIPHLTSLLKNEIPSIKASEDAFVFNISYQRNFIKKYLKEFDIYFSSLEKVLERFSEVLKWYRFSNRNLFEIANTVIQYHADLMIILNELKSNIKEYILMIK